MRSWHTLAWKELRAQKLTSVLILIALILSTMMTTVIGQSIGILSAMREHQAAYLNGNRYVSFHQLSSEQADALSADSRLSYAEQIISAGIVDLPSRSNMSILLREYEGNALSAYDSIARLESGRLPKRAGEIALPEDALSMLGFTGALDDTIALDATISLLWDDEAPYEYTKTFVLTGILKANYLGYVTGSINGIVGSGTAKQLLPEKYLLYSVDIRTADKREFQNTVDEFAQTYDIPEYCVQYNDTLLSVLGIDYRSGDISQSGDAGFTFMTLAGILIGALVLLAAGLVVYNILKISITKRVKEYGTLRAVGAQSGQLYALVSIQLVILCMIGIPIGGVFGVLSAKGITTAATSFFSPEIFMASSQSEVAVMIANSSGNKLLPFVVSTAITLAFSFLAVMPAARYAAKVSPTLAISGQMTKIKRRSRKTGRIRSFASFYARMNMKRNRGRTAITILSLVMSITVFIALNSFSDLLDTSIDVQAMHLGDYSMTNEAVGFTPEALDELNSLSDIERIATLKYQLYMPDADGNVDVDASFSLMPGEALHIVGIDEARILSLMPDIPDADLQALKNGESCLIKNPIPISYGGETADYTEFKPGDTITVNGKTLVVAGIADKRITVENSGFVNGVQIIAYDIVYDQLTGHSNYTELYPVLSETADRVAVETVIENLCSKTGGTWLSYENTDRQLRETYEQIRLFAWGLILFVGLIGLLNIINTVYTNIHTRTAEIATQRAIGMSKYSLYGTFLWEGAYYGIIAAMLGSLAGYICTVFVGAAATDTIQLVAVPFSSIVQATGFSIGACVLATCIPLRQIADMDIIKLHSGY